jgi:hypothetical protein
VEKIIIKFLRNTLDMRISRAKDTIVLCYRTLGLTALSAGSVHFCAEMLLKKDMRALFGLTNETEQLHRMGAALALFLMGPNLGQGEVLTKASRSLFRSLKRAYNEAKNVAEEYLARTRREGTLKSSPR